MSQPTPNLAPFSCLFVHGPSEMGVYDLDHFQAANDEKDDLAARHSVRTDVTYCPSSIEEFASHGASASIVLFLTEEILDELRHSDVKTLRKMHQNGMPIAVAGDGKTLRKLLNVKTSQPNKKSRKKGAKKQNAPSDTTLYVTHQPKGQPGSELHFSGQNLTDTLRNLHVASTIQELHINHHRKVVGQRPMALAAVAASDGPANENNPGPWNADAPAKIFTYTNSAPGSNPWPAVHSRLWLLIYKLNSDDKDFNYYLFFTKFSQGAQAYRENCTQLGPWSNTMQLGLSCVSPGVKLYDWGPNSTVGSTTESFSVGGGLEGIISPDGPGGGGSANASWGVSFTTPDVRIIATPTYATQPNAPEGVKWDVTLPGVGYVSPGVPATPRQAAISYFWDAAVIFQIPKGNAPAVKVNLNVEWSSSWPRGTFHNPFNWVLESDTLTFPE